MFHDYKQLLEVTYVRLALGKRHQRWLMGSKCSNYENGHISAARYGGMVAQAHNPSPWEAKKNCEFKINWVYIARSSLKNSK